MAKGSLRDRGGGPVRRPAESRRREGGRFRGRFVRLVRCAAFGCLLAAPAPSAGAAPDARLVYVPESTVKVCQLTGDRDRQTGVPTLSLTERRAGVAATDLGSSFEHGGRLVFLFGDTWRYLDGRDAGVARDALAWTDSCDPTAIELSFLCGGDGRWLPLEVPGLSHGPFEVPLNGVSIGGKMYVVFAMGFRPPLSLGRSVLAVSEDDGRTFRQVYQLSEGKFRVTALWKEDPWLYVFGAGEYRRSSVCLARIETARIHDRSSLRYFSGTDGEGAARWSAEEREAAFLFRHDVVGEHSVAYCPAVGRYVMLYNSSAPRGIVMRSAPRPWGAWSEAEVVFDPWRDKGYGFFMHRVNLLGGKGDGLADPGRVLHPGGEYGPYIMARYTTGDAKGCRLFYTMSTWNPYQVVVMRTDLKLE
ncbi:MAG: DUF4185 domain-containing protein [Planctomycetes bacterium]|jgi:hypothetical protein|nr:DUF4185 domain-containing protein [Planctomycetota bacterium]OQC21778.1 MAG: hypothetical protein BWX69_00709 [Planctomycetes bacterium ADurb.Bin069]